MKNTILLFAGLLLLFYCNFSYCGNESNIKGETKNTLASDGSLTIQCTPGLYDLATKWAAEFGKVNPGIRINILKTPGSGKDEILQPGENLFLLSNGPVPLPGNDAEWKMVVGRDVIVPVINSENPLIKEIYEQGISAENLARLFNDPAPGWGSLLAKGKDIPLHFFTTNDATINSNLAAFLNMDQIPEAGTKVKDGKGTCCFHREGPLWFRFL
jgi:ABC-type phosphate transport system substrate-binding protein